MIYDFADKETEKIYNGNFSKKLPESIQRIALRKLMMIDAANNLNDLRVPPANHLELLSGNIVLELIEIIVFDFLLKTKYFYKCRNC